MELERIDDEGLGHLVEAFYARVRADEELGPIFNDAISDWPEHLGKLTDFWSSVMLTTGRYKGQPVPAHMKHRSKITPALFERWLGLWAETTDAIMEPAAARALQDKARRIAQSLQLAMFFRIDADQPAGRANIPERVAAS
ncbi:group III truncated hemoglobin [uncultured Croceicoccus sp.]|jgi:hemoglobin|uniref:group III truncated hemoglobin n=1 Tax=uncultured Croceicoccus sp. TaxID=1295329 RepID=UPI00261FF283|nr:group III truncated hemoglobin [uncultured Croceicoccus sp.]